MPSGRLDYQVPHCLLSLKLREYLVCLYIHIYQLLQVQRNSYVCLTLLLT